MPEHIKPYAPLISNLLYGLAILVIGWMVSKWTHRLVKSMLGRTKTEESLARFLASIAQYVVLAATVIASLNQVGVQTTSLVALLASAGLAIGLALQGSLSNFASGVMILGFRPFMLDDFVEIGGKSGTVDDIGLFMTQLVTPNNEVVLVPNSSITGNTITNFTAKGVRRCVIDIGVGYGENVRTVSEVLLEVAKGHEFCLEEPGPSVVLSGFGASSVDFQVRAFATNENFWPMVNELRLRIFETLNEKDIEIPFNQIVVHQAPTSDPQ
ncbi:MAG: mechanosensitive ion channel family protein [Candidatus Eremiobacteraeota bacterium]|nr:mechanosensitive ion channel family protein [Candidatus Eremiobacteraeota bacterium]